MSVWGHMCICTGVGVFVYVCQYVCMFEYMCVKCMCGQCVYMHVCVCESVSECVCEHSRGLRKVPLLSPTLSQCNAEPPVSAFQSGSLLWPPVPQGVQGKGVSGLPGAVTVPDSCPLKPCRLQGSHLRKLPLIPHAPSLQGCKTLNPPLGLSHSSLDEPVLNTPSSSTGAWPGSRCWAR